MAFKIGDKVRISYNWRANANDDMIEDQEARDSFAGQTITIESIVPGLNGYVYFDNSCADSHGHIYGWFEDQLILVEEKEKMKPLIEDCKYFDGAGKCLGTKEMDPCSLGYCPSLPGVLKNQDVAIHGVEPDAPVVTNEQGGKQSDTPYAFHMIPISSIFAAANTLAYGAKKYGETFDNRNYTKISTEDHINHAVQHLYAFLAGDTQDDHLGHAIVRCMFAYDTAQRRGFA